MRMHYHIWLIGAACALAVLAAGQLMALIDSRPAAELGGALAPGPTPTTLTPKTPPSASPMPGLGQPTLRATTIPTLTETLAPAAVPREPTPVRQSRFAPRLRYPRQIFSEDLRSFQGRRNTRSFQWLHRT